MELALTHSRQPVIGGRFPRQLMKTAEKKEDAMPLGRVLLLLVAGSLTGCAVERSSHSVSFLPSTGGVPRPAGPDVVQIQLAIVEVPVGDSYVTEEMWGLADEQQIPRDQRTVLHENGFRIGQIRGITPPGLQQLLTSERNNPAPRSNQVRAGVPCTIELGPPLADCRCQLRENGRTTPVHAANAQLGLEVTPSITGEGRICLRFNPRLGFGGASVDHGGPAGAPLWLLLTQRSARTFPQVGWDVTLEPNEYVVIGGILDQPPSLGHCCFVRADEANTVQRLLVIRTSRVQSELPLEEMTNAGILKHAPPLAMQAAWPSVRGCTP
jgi:hypothetical protein